MMSRILSITLLLTVAGCSSPLPPPPKAPPATRPVVATPSPTTTAQRPTGDWTDWPLSLGDWVYRRDDRGSIALFGVAGNDATVTLRCDKTRGRIYLARSGAGASGKMVVRSSSTLKELATSPTGGALPYLASEIVPTDPILDAVVYSRGRFALEVDGQLPIAIPSWAEIGRVVEDCRG
jgi:hypothetical protein